MRCRRSQDRIQVVMPRHEQAAIHMADGYYRVKGRPLAVFTSIGAGASNTAIGLATAYVDSIPLLLFIGETHTYMRGVRCPAGTGAPELVGHAPYVVPGSQTRLAH